MIQPRKGKIMNWDQVEGNWHQLKGKLRQHWGKFSDDELDVMHGKREEFVGKLQEKYGITKEQAEDELNSFLRNVQ